MHPATAAAPRNTTPNNKVLSQTYGAFADLRRELCGFKTPSPSAKKFCAASRRAQFATLGCCSKIISKNFPFRAKIFPLPNGGRACWPPPDGPRRGTRLPVSPRQALAPARISHACEYGSVRPRRSGGHEQTGEELENWLFPPRRRILIPLARDAACRLLAETGRRSIPRFRLGVQFHLFRPRTGEKCVRSAT